MRAGVIALVGVMVLLAVVLSGCSLIESAQPAAWPPSQSGRPVFYYFGDPGWPACVTTKPVVDRLEDDYRDKVDFVVYGTVNSDQAAGQFASQHGVSAIPTMMIVGADGTEIDRYVGGADEAALRKLIDQSLER